MSGLSTDDTFNFCLTTFGRVSEILAVITLPDKNGSTKLLHLNLIIPVCGHVMLFEIIDPFIQFENVSETFGTTCRLSSFSFVQPWRVGFYYSQGFA